MNEYFIDINPDSSFLMPDYSPVILGLFFFIHVGHEDDLPPSVPLPYE